MFWKLQDFTDNIFFLQLLSTYEVYKNFCLSNFGTVHERNQKPRKILYHSLFTESGFEIASFYNFLLWSKKNFRVLKTIYDFA